MMRKNVIAAGVLTLSLIGCQAATESANPPPPSGANSPRGNPANAAEVASPAPSGSARGMRKHEFSTEERFGATVVYFAKTICPSCAEQDPLYQNFIRNLPSGVEARKVFEHEVDADWYAIDHYPTIVIFEDGAEVWRHVGVSSEQLLRNAVQPYAANVSNWVR